MVIQNKKVIKIDSEAILNLVRALLNEKEYDKIIEGYNTLFSDEQRDMFDTIKIKVFNRVKKKYKGYPKLLLKELILFASITDTNEEIDAIRNKRINYCSNCGWCCDNCDIYLTTGDMQKLMIYGIEEPTITGKQNRKKFKNQPCRLRVNNRCSIYKIRPDSCATYPVTYYNNKYIINRKPFCEFTLKLVEIRLEAYMSKIKLLEQENKEVKAVLHS